MHARIWIFSAALLSEQSFLISSWLKRPHPGASRVQSSAWPLRFVCRPLSRIMKACSFQKFFRCCMMLAKCLSVSMKFLQWCMLSTASQGRVFSLLQLLPNPKHASCDNCRSYEAELEKSVLECPYWSADAPWRWSCGTMRRKPAVVSGVGSSVLTILLCVFSLLSNADIATWQYTVFPTKW